MLKINKGQLVKTSLLQLPKKTTQRTKKLEGYVSLDARGTISTDKKRVTEDIYLCF